MNGAGVDDLIKLIALCVSDQIVKADAKICLSAVAEKTEKLSSADCVKLCNAAEQKIKPKIQLFANEVSITFNTNQTFQL